MKSTSSSQRRAADGGSGALVGARVGAGQGDRAVREACRARSGRWRRRARRARSSTSSSGRGASTPRSVNAGTTRSVTAETTPSAPRPTRAARSSSGSPAVGGDGRAVGQHELQRLDLGGDVAQPRAGAVRTGGDRAGDASARRCRRGSRSASPSASSWALSAPRRDPGLDPHEARSPGRGRARGPCASRLSSVPSVQATSPKECPAPATRTRRPRAAARSSARDDLRHRCPAARQRPASTSRHRPSCASVLISPSARRSAAGRDDHRR